MMKKVLKLLKEKWIKFYRPVKQFARTFEPIFRIIEIGLIIVATLLSVASIKSSSQSTKEISQYLAKIDSIFYNV